MFSQNIIQQFQLHGLTSRCHKSRLILNIIVLTLVAFLIPFGSYAQDLIIQKNGEEIEAKVQELGIDYIKYKRFNHLDGPTVVLAKADVFLIKYENGTKELFKDASPTQSIQPANNNFDSTIPSSESSEENLSTIRLKWDGKKMMVRGNIQIYWNVEYTKKGWLLEHYNINEVGTGNYKEGFDVEFKAPPGTYDVIMRQGKKGKGATLFTGQIEIKEANQNYIAKFKYKKLINMFALESVEKT